MNSGCSSSTQTLKESLLIQTAAAHGNGGDHPEDGVIQNRAVLPLGENAFPVQLSELRVTQPHCREVYARAADASHQFDADDSVFADVAFRAFHAQFMERFQIVLVDCRDDSALFGCLNKCAEGFELVNWLGGHRVSPSAGYYLIDFKRLTALRSDLAVQNFAI